MRRAVVLAGLALAVLAPPATALETTGAAPTRYALDLDFSPRGAGKLSGTQWIDVENRGPAPVSTVWLRLWGNGPDGCRPRRVSVTLLASGRLGRERAGCTALPVHLGEPLAPGAATSIGLRLTVRGRRRHDRFGRHGSTVLLGNVIPVVAAADRRGLRLPPYVHNAESFYSTSASWDATFRMPSSHRLASTGASAGEAVRNGVRRVTVSTPRARDFGLAIGRFRTSARRVGGVRVRVHSRSSARVRRYMLRSAARALRLFAARFGAYGSPELDVVETGASPVGMEYPEFVMSVPDDITVAHEVAHQWWYSLVGNDQFHEPWLDESLASYSDHLYSGSFAGCRVRRPFAGFPRGPLDGTMRHFRGGGSRYGAVVYAGGACALRSLERTIGRRRMARLLRLIVARHRGGVITKADFLRALRETAPPGFRLGTFLRRARLSG